MTPPIVGECMVGTGERRKKAHRLQAARTGTRRAGAAAVPTCRCVSSGRLQQSVLRRFFERDSELPTPSPLIDGYLGLSGISRRLRRTSPDDERHRFHPMFSSFSATSCRATSTFSGPPAAFADASVFTGPPDRLSTLSAAMWHHVAQRNDDASSRTGHRSRTSARLPAFEHLRFPSSASNATHRSSIEAFAAVTSSPSRIAAPSV